MSVLWQISGYGSHLAIDNGAYGESSEQNLHHQRRRTHSRTTPPCPSAGIGWECSALAQSAACSHMHFPGHHADGTIAP